MKLLYRSTNWLFSVPEGSRSLGSVIVWWELRRIPYNIIVGMAGAISLALFFVLISSAQVLRPGEDAVEPIALLFAPILINIFYTGGWVSEILARFLMPNKSQRIGPILFKAGLGFSLLVVATPTLFWAGYRALQLAGVLT